ncbi:hypothetical protein RND71_005593 [Anisodus tanguticus]|uniref:Uncharacterized protein n=1 Tax=Anisodus tanguticus TaxID=243964 RepID=A0AAE1SUH7_9SOLA|nr:hypothetical protein RND71_005593 [Anisodus tanguticus]
MSTSLRKNAMAIMLILGARAADPQNARTIVFAGKSGDLYSDATLRKLSLCFSASDLHIVLVSISVEMQTSNAPIPASNSDIHQNIRLASVEAIMDTDSNESFTIFCDLHKYKLVSAKYTFANLNEVNQPSHLKPNNYYVNINRRAIALICAQTDHFGEIERLNLSRCDTLAHLPGMCKAKQRAFQLVILDAEMSNSFACKSL